MFFVKIFKSLKSIFGKKKEKRSRLFKEMLYDISTTTYSRKEHGWLVYQNFGIDVLYIKEDSSLFPQATFGTPSKEEIEQKILATGNENLIELMREYIKDVKLYKGVI